jgi:hypothetical protein
MMSNPMDRRVQKFKPNQPNQTGPSHNTATPTTTEHVIQGVDRDRKRAKGKKGCIESGQEKVSTMPK